MSTTAELQVQTHIRFDAQGRPWIDDSNIKVIEVAAEWLAHRISPEEMFLEHYGTLSMAQIHAALAYYFDHQAELDAEIERQSEEIEKLRAASLNSPLRQRLRALGKLP